jgi:hypothetical protein
VNNTRRLARLPFLLLLVLPALLVAQAAKKTPPKTTTGAGLTAPTFPLKIATEFLGMVKEKTVVRVTLTSPELAAGLRKVGIEAFRGDLHGTFLKDGVSVVDEFDYPVAGELSEGAAFRHAFLRAVPPGTYKLSVVLKAAGHDVAESAVEVAVPEVGETFRAEMAPGETGTLPTPFCWRKRRPVRVRSRGHRSSSCCRPTRRPRSAGCASRPRSRSRSCASSSGSATRRS